MVESVLTQEQAKSLGYIPLKEAAALPNVGDHSTLWRKVKARELPGAEVHKGSRVVLYVLRSALGQKASISSTKDYNALQQQFLDQMLDGTFTGKPNSEEYVENSLAYGLRYYWRILGIERTVEGLNADNYDIVMGCDALKVDDVNRKDHYSNKMHIYRACTRFTDFLIQKGLKSESDRKAFKKPKQKYKPQRRMLEEEQRDEALAFNKSWRNGREDNDIYTTDLLMSLYVYAGIRRSEVITIRLSDIDFKNGVILVLGKGSKERYVPINLFPELAPKLSEWIFKLRPKSSSNLLIVQANGSPLKKGCIKDRFQRLSIAMRTEKAYEQLVAAMAGKPFDPKELRKKAKTMQKSIDFGVRPHDLRRTFATILAKRGMPLSMLQLILGHADISTTQGYVLTNIRHVLDWTKANMAPAVEELAVGEYMDVEDLPIEVQEYLSNLI